MVKRIQRKKLGGNLEFSWYSCNILRYCSNRCIVWFSIPAISPAQANRKFPVQLYVKIQIIFEPPALKSWQCHVRGKCCTCPGPFFGHVVIVEATVHIIQSSVIYMPVLVPLQLRLLWLIWNKINYKVADLIKQLYVIICFIFFDN
jgi:hypothetical protein